MCGISGIHAFNEIGRIFAINLHKANEALTHRGPDTGFLFNEYYTGLGHRRLSIIDLSHGADQPMTDPSGRYTMVFNGEIYNFKILREELQAKGVEFKTQSDTEVLLHLFIHEGKACLPKLHGFFAFAIFDKQENSLFLARDRFGIKPLVYYHDEDKFLFASELNALLQFNIPKEINYQSLYLYFQLHYIPAPHTIYENTYKLEPGHCLEIKGKQVHVEPYYHLPAPQENQSQPPVSYEAAQKQLLKLLEESVEERMVSDVPLGAFLSGGIDSSTVVALASKFTPNLNTFSVGFKDEPLFDETHYAQLVAERYKTNHTVFQLSNDDYFEHLFDLLNYYGEPFADSSAIPFYILSKQTREKVTVCLSGDGADEVFAGYNKYRGEFQARNAGAKEKLVSAMYPLWNALPKSRNHYLGNKIRQLHRFAEGMHKSPQERYWYLTSWNTEQNLQSLLRKEILDKIDQQAFQSIKNGYLSPIQGKNFNEVLYSDVKLLLPNDMLHKVDSMSMANSLEVRVPFLDHRLVEFAFSLPAEYKIHHGMKKRILQDAVRPLLPEKLYKRPKQGFDVPLARGYKGELRHWIDKEMFKEDFIREQGIFEWGKIKHIKHQVFNTNNFDQNRVWALLAFQYWWKQSIDQPKAKV
ncbi:asparagine synthase (glutamine-hydrolyzing) [Rapidithrix thailandica]|uniref:asparagine synthase (glutamine-hydrolyzing) n=1 Tax=Rapidithrix thailandica TaxID=413964 RepID=A0AAW9S589_9BACT